MKKTKSEKYLNDIDGNNFKEIKKLFYILLVIFVILVPIYIVLQLSSNKNNDVKIENKYNENKILATSVLATSALVVSILVDLTEVAGAWVVVVVFAEAKPRPVVVNNVPSTRARNAWGVFLYIKILPNHGKG